ncbi:MAG: class I SAM-dependent methyltransferase [Chryseolinea sp.]
MDSRIVDKLREKLSGRPKVLDVGFGTGRIVFDILMSLDPIQIVGIESQTRAQIQSCLQPFVYHGITQDKGVLSLVSDREIDLFDYYQHYAKTLEKTAVDFDTFDRNVQLHFEMEFDKFLALDKSRFDLVVLFNVLHYTSLGEPLNVIEKVKNILTENGLLLIAFKDYKHSLTNLDRQKVRVDNIIQHLNNDFDLLLFEKFEDSESTIYVGQRYALQQP